MEKVMEQEMETGVPCGLYWACSQYWFIVHGRNLAPCVCVAVVKPGEAWTFLWLPTFLGLATKARWPNLAYPTLSL